MCPDQIQWRADRINVYQEGSNLIPTVSCWGNVVRNEPKALRGSFINTKDIKETPETSRTCGKIIKHKLKISQ